jgi:hypothetical protein
MTLEKPENLGEATRGKGGLAMDVSRLNELTKQLDVLRVLTRLTV